MRRAIAMFVVLAGLAAAPGASATINACPDFDYHGYHVRGLREQNIGCEFAHGIARHVVDHGGSELHSYRCTSTLLPKDVTEWSCSAVKKGEKYGAQFGLQPFARSH